MVEVSKATLLRYADTLSGEYVSDDDIDSVADGLRALSAQQREPVVRVKELEWVACADGTHHDTGCNYEVEQLGGGWRVIRGVTFGGSYVCDVDTLAEAKSAAQADYEQRIMAAIEIQSSDGGNGGQP